MLFVEAYAEACPTKVSLYKPKFHLARHVNSRHDTFGVSSPCILAVSSLSKARLDTFVSTRSTRRVET